MILSFLFYIFMNVGACFADGGTFSDIFQSYQQTKESIVVKVISADTIVLEDGRHIKMIGIESFGPLPRILLKYDKNGKIIEEPIEPTIPLEVQAVYFAADLLENKKVKLEYDVDALDEHHQRQAYIFLPNGKLANAELLREGFVRLKIRPPNLKYAQDLRNAYQEARTQQRGFLSN